MSPEVPFLKPTGQETPETSWRWTWLSVVRAPMAPQLTRPAMYCGEIMSRNSVPAGDAHLGEVEQEIARQAQAVVDLVGIVEVRIVDEALPADGGARLFEVDAHDDLEVGGELRDGGFEERAYSRAALVSWMEQGPTRTSRRGSRWARMREMSSAGVEDGGEGVFGDGAFFFQKDRRKDNLGPLDAKMLSVVWSMGCN